MEKNTVPPEDIDNSRISFANADDDNISDDDILDDDLDEEDEDFDEDEPPLGVGDEDR